VNRRNWSRPTLVWLALAAGVTASACATPARDITSEEIAEADVIIHRAVTAGAERFAPGLLWSSREALDAAQRASFTRKPDEARRRLEEAKAYATAAEIRARAEQRRREALAVGQEADALEVKLQDLQRRLRTPGPSAQ